MARGPATSVKASKAWSTSPMIPCCQGLRVLEWKAPCAHCRMTRHTHAASRRMQPDLNKLRIQRIQTPSNCVSSA